MSGKPLAHKVYEFGEFRLLSAELMLYRGEDEILLPPKAVETLLALVERRGHIVSRDELMDAIWSDTIVEESNLSRYIHVLRSTLGERAEGKPFIETFRRRGYRFSGDVSVTVPNPDLTPLAERGHEMPPPARDIHVTGAGNVVALASWHREAEQPDPVSAPDLHPVDTPPSNESRPVTPTRRVVVIALASIALFALGGLGLYALLNKSSNPLNEKDPVLVADFDNRTGDDVFDGTLKQGLSAHLQQSSFISLFPEERVRATLKLMKRSPDEKVTPDLAAEICQRQGLKAYVRGSIVQLGRNYVLTLEAINANTGEIISGEQAEAEGKENVLTALSRAASNLRARLGESLTSIERLNFKQWELTTVSIEAFRLITLARLEARKANWTGSISLVQQAIQIDPEFASAYRWLAVYYWNNGQPELAVDPARRAYGLRDRVGDIERLSIDESYCQFVTLEADKQIEILLVKKRLMPDDFQPSGFLTLHYYLNGEYERAVSEANEALQKGAIVPYTVLARALVALGRYDEARTAADQGLVRGLDDRTLYEARTEVAFLTGNEDGFAEAVRNMETKQFRHRPAAYLAFAAAYRGQLKTAKTNLQKALSIAERQNAREWIVTYLLDLATLDALLKNDCSKNTALVDRALSVSRWDTSLARSASLMAECRDEAGAKKLIAELLQKRPNGTVANLAAAPSVRAMIALEKDDAAGAFEALSAVPENLKTASEFRVQYLRGLTLLRLNRDSEAAVQFRDIIDHPGLDPFSPLYPLAHLGLGRALAKTNDLQGALEMYERFFEIWKDADEDLPDLIAAKNEYRQLRQRL